MEEETSELSNSVLLSKENVKFWISHLDKITEEVQLIVRRKTTSTSAVCKKRYIEETKKVENWIQCEKCNVWFHFNCVGIVIKPDNFTCHFW